MMQQRPLQALRQHRHAIATSLATANRHLVTLQVEILHAQPQPLEQTHPGPVQQRDHQRRRPVPLHRREQLADFDRREHDRNARRTLRAHYPREPSHR